MAEPLPTSEPLIVGRYALYDEIASGGMATVHLGRLLGAAGFSRVVAVKRLHRHYANNPEFVAMFVDEARLAARIRHPNVVPTLDVVRTADELFLVMEYVNGESLAKLLRVIRDQRLHVSPGIAASIAIGMLHGLHAAHTARGEGGEPLEIVHRDVSPQNVMVGTDGVARVLDFGIAKARVRVQTTRSGQIKGKLGYVSPEQLRGNPLGPFTDVYAAGVVLWEMLTGRRLFEAEEEASLLMQVLNGPTSPPSALVKGLPRPLDDVVMRSMAADPTERFASAKEMAAAIERTCQPANASTVGEWVEWLASERLHERSGRISMIESDVGLKALADVVTPVQAIPSSVSSSSAALRGHGPRSSDSARYLHIPEPGTQGTPVSFSALPTDVDSSRGTPSGGSDADVVPTVTSAVGSGASAAAAAAASRGAKGQGLHRWLLLGGLVLGLIAVATAGAVWVLRADPGEETASAAARGDERDEATTGAAVTSALTTATVAAATSSAPSATADATPTSTSSATASVTEEQRPPERPRPRRPPPPAKPARPKVDCSIPYVVDQEGIRHIRPECVD